MKQPIPVFAGDIVDKKLKMLNRERKALLLWCNTFPNGTHVDITIRKHKTTRSTLQNSYYWGAVLPILADYFGYDNTVDIHEEMKMKFNPIPSKIDKGKMIGGSTTRLSTVEFFSAEDSYINRIRRWAAMDFSIYIPDPEKIT